MGLMIDCADLGLTRTPERTELLYPRSKLVTTAKAFDLQAIDLVSPRPLQHLTRCRYGGLES